MRRPVAYVHVHVNKIAGSSSKQSDICTYYNAVGVQQERDIQIMIAIN